MSHPYAMVGCLLSPNPTIMKYAVDHKDDNDQMENAVTLLIKKLLLPENKLVGVARDEKRAYLVNTFWEEYSDFTLRLGKFANPDMWVIASNPKQFAHMWHKTYSLGRTKVLGRLACLVCSKNLGIGQAERQWKIMKLGKSGQRARMGTQKNKKSSLIYGAAMQQRSNHDKHRLHIAGKLWQDEDFDTLKLNFHCGEIVQAAQALPSAPVRIFKAWEEEWEKVQVGPGGDDRLQARLVNKYAGLRWLDREFDFCLVVAHLSKMFFEKKRGANKYMIFATYPGYDLSKSPDEQTDKFDGWMKTQADFYEEVVEYYKDIPEVKCYKEGGEAESDSDEE